MTRAAPLDASPPVGAGPGGLPVARRYDSVVIGAFKYPQGDASSQRLLTLAQTLADSGRKALVINDGDSHAPVGYRPGTVASVRGVDYVCLPSGSGGRLRRLGHRASRPLRVAMTIRRLAAPGRATWTILASGLCTPGLVATLRAVVRSTLVADIVERHDAVQFARGRCAPYFLRHRFTSWLAGVATDRLIVISSRLARDHVKARRQPLVVPALVDTSEYLPIASTAGDRVTLLYLGSPAGKDRLGVVLDAIAQLPPPALARLRFHIAGCDRAQLAANPDVGVGRLERLGDTVVVEGSVPRPQVLKILAAADFTVLVRPSGGYADAGFPTKVSESLAAGCPVLGNLTSDLGEYLVDGQNSLLCSPGSGSREVPVAAVREALLRALALTDEERLMMRENARRSSVRLSTTEWAPRVRAALEEST